MPKRRLIQIGSGINDRGQKNFIPKEGVNYKVEILTHYGKTIWSGWVNLMNEYEYFSKKEGISSEVFPWKRYDHEITRYWYL